MKQSFGIAIVVGGMVAGMPARPAGAQEQRTYVPAPPMPLNPTGPYTSPPPYYGPPPSAPRQEQPPQQSQVPAQSQVPMQLQVPMQPQAPMQPPQAQAPLYPSSPYAPSPYAGTPSPAQVPAPAPAAAAAEAPGAVTPVPAIRERDPMPTRVAPPPASPALDGNLLAHPLTVRADLSAAGPTGELGVSAEYVLRGRVGLEGGFGSGLAGMALAALGRYYFPFAPERSVAIAFGPSITLGNQVHATSPPRDVGTQLGVWLNTEFDYQYRTAAGRVVQGGFGIAKVVGDSGPFVAGACSGLCVDRTTQFLISSHGWLPYLRVGLGFAP